MDKRDPPLGQIRLSEKKSYTTPASAHYDRHMPVKQDLRNGKNKSISIRLSLLLYGFIPMFICAVLFTIILLVMTSRLLQEREENNLINNTRILSNLLDSELSKIKRVSLNLAFSETLKEAIKEYTEIKTTSDDPEILYYPARKIQSILNETVGPLKQVSQVNILLADNEIISFGLYNLRQSLPGHYHSRLRRLFMEKRNSWWSPPERDYLSESLGGMDSSKNYISHYQVLFDEFRTPLAYIEVKQETEVFFEGLKEISENFQIFNAQNLQVFPLTQPYGNSDPAIASELVPYRIIHVRNRLNRKREVLCLGISTEASWRVINIISENRYKFPIYKIQIILIPLILFIALLGYLISHRLSLGITASLTNLNSKLNQVQWRRNEEETLTPNETGIRELNDLELSFAEMNRKMDEKLDMFVAEKTLEVNARMLALQSQMDPHFLFNMLTIIDIMADEGQGKEIQDVVSHLSTLLRYTSSLQELTVPLSMELKMAGHYMECIAFRFGDTIKFDRNVPEDITEFKIPKYSIIPLLENAVKYGMPDGEDCLISLSARQQGQRWSITVKDNGPGFQKDSLEKLNARIRRGINDPQMQLNNQINGMGLFNICSRYSLLYGKEFKFEAVNRKNGGAKITLGGMENA